MDMRVPSADSTDFLQNDSIFYAVVYGAISFFIVLALILLLYLSCLKRFRLNWYERNLLENSLENEEMSDSHTALLIGSDENRGSCPILNRFSDDKGRKRSSGMQRGSNTDISGDESPGTPSTRRGSKISVGVDSLSAVEEGVEYTGPQPLVRSDKHIILSSTLPTKPLVSMNSKLDHTQIDAALYSQKSEENLIDVPNNSLGSIQLLLNYEPSAAILSVRLVQANNLKPRELSGSADPYAKIRLLPDRSNVWQTRIHKKTLNPVFDEDFVFEVRPIVLPKRTLEIILYDFDANSRHQSLGSIKIPFVEFDFNDKITISRNLEPCSEKDDKAELGELMVSMCFLPSAERLTVVIVKARNLRIVDENKVSSDPYVKVIVYQGGKRLKKKKTSIHRNTINPTFNERLTFDINKETLSKCSIELCVYHDNKLGPAELLGRVLVGASSSCKAEDRAFFKDVLNSKTAVSSWLVLSCPQ